MSHHSKHDFITQYISLRGTAVNEFYQMIRMGAAGYAKPGLHTSPKHRLENMFFFFKAFQLWLGICVVVMITGIDLSQEIFAINVLRMLNPL